MNFDTKIALAVREDLAAWQKLNVTAFLVSGITGAVDGLLGARYEDADGQSYLPLAIQPMVIFSATAQALQRTHQRALSRGVSVAIYIEDMFETGHDAANRETVRRHATSALPLVGIGFRTEKKVADKITKGLKLHT